MDSSALGRWFIGFGLLIVLVGVFMMMAGKISWVGRLPGDIYIKRDNVTFYFPLVTSFVISVGVSLLIQFFGKK